MKLKLNVKWDWMWFSGFSSVGFKMCISIFYQREQQSAVKAMFYQSIMDPTYRDRQLYTHAFNEWTWFEGKHTAVLACCVCVWYCMQWATRWIIHQRDANNELLLTNSTEELSVWRQWPLSVRLRSATISLVSLTLTDRLLSFCYFLGAAPPLIIL